MDGINEGNCMSSYYEMDSADNIPYYYEPYDKYIPPVEITFIPEPVYIDWGNCTPLPPGYLSKEQMELVEIKDLLKQILRRL